MIVIEGERMNQLPLEHALSEQNVIIDPEKISIELQENPSSTRGQRENII
jgi:hypothetical protein